MRSNRRWNGLAAALAIAALSACAERDPFDPATVHYRPQLAAVPGPIVFDFEGFAPDEVLSDQYADRGVIISSASAADGTRINPDFAEPRSGVAMAWSCVFFDECGRLGVSFPEGAIAVGAYVTGVDVVTLTCYDAADNALGSASTPGANMKGNPDGLALHILLEVAAPGIARCEFTSAQLFLLDDLQVTPAPQEVTVLVDVQQGSVNLKSQGLLPVAILGEPGFDPVADVNLSTVTLGDGSDEDTPLARKRHGTYMAAGDDVNSDGLRDLVLHFSTPSLVTNGDLTSASTELVLRGATKNGVAFAGSDAIRVVP
jgi:hypothetical protein